MLLLLGCAMPSVCLSVLLQGPRAAAGSGEGQGSLGTGEQNRSGVSGMLQAGPGLGSFLSHLAHPQGSSVPRSFVFLTKS